jgi:uncharacterized protein (TIGR02266 family)
MLALHCARPRPRIEPNRRLALAAEAPDGDECGEYRLVDPNTRQGKRTPVTLKIKFKSETLDQFIERYAVDVSQGGIFIRTKEPLAVGTQMKFEFQLRDASPLIAGEGTVVWTRENDPSRPAIAPGMGVRFDRLADGSQGILERILTEKAKQAPQRPASDTAKPPLFTDTPTRVAPAPIQEALLGKDYGRGRRTEEAQADSHTPLPKPMPFHSDADEFPDEAFEEATKVRALDELIAQTAESDTRPAPRGEARIEARAEARGEARIENTSRSRVNGRGDVADPIPDRAEQIRPTVLPSHAELQEVPDLPNPPEPVRLQPRLLDVSPLPRIESMPPSLPDALAKTRLGVEPARARIAPSTPPPPPMGAIVSEIPPVPSGMRAVAHEQTEPARMPELKARSIAPLLIVIFLAVAAAGAAVWFFVLRPQIGEPRDRGTATPSVGSTGSAAAPPVATAGSGSAPTAAPATPPATGAPPPGPGPGSAAPSSAGATPAELVETEIAADGPSGAKLDGVTVEIGGTDQQGPAPFTARLEKAKSYKVRITARGFATSEIDVKGGDSKQTAKLVAKPRLLLVSSDPPGAQISIDGTPTGKLTPFEVELTAAQAMKKSVRVVLRKAGFRLLDRTIDFAKFTDGDTKMTAKLDEKLTPAPVATRPPAGARPPPAGSDTGSAAGSPDGAAPPSGGSAQGGDSSTPPAPPPTPPAPPPSGGAAGSAEPEPDFNKPK